MHQKPELLRTAMTAMLAMMDARETTVSSPEGPRSFTQAMRDERVATGFFEVVMRTGMTADPFARPEDTEHARLLITGDGPIAPFLMAADHAVDCLSTDNTLERDALVSAASRYPTITPIPSINEAVLPTLAEAVENSQAPHPKARSPEGNT